MTDKGFQFYKALGWKRHSKHSLYGHYFQDDVCLDCGLTIAEFNKRIGRETPRKGADR